MVHVKLEDTVVDYPHLEDALMEAARAFGWKATKKEITRKTYYIDRTVPHGDNFIITEGGPYEYTQITLNGKIFSALKIFVNKDRPNPFTVLYGYPINFTSEKTVKRYLDAVASRVKF